METSKEFWARVEKTDGCWEWQGAIAKSGYGACYFQGRFSNAHRLAWTLTHGPIPNGMWVLHKCDNRKCVRPSHLYLGTVRENARDAVERGRHPRGETNGLSKLTEEQVREIRNLRTTGMPYRKIGSLFSITHAQAERIVSRENWSHVQ